MDWSSFQGEEGAGSLPFPVHMADVLLQNNGRNHILPSCLVHRAPQTNRKTTISQARPPSCSSGGHRAAPAAGDPSLPSSSYWTFSRHALCGSCDTQVSQLYLLQQPSINTSLWTLLFPILGNIIGGWIKW